MRTPKTRTGPKTGQRAAKRGQPVTRNLTELEKSEAIAYALEELSLVRLEKDVRADLERDFQCSKIQAQALVDKAAILMRESLQIPAEELRAILEKRLEALYRKAMTVNDLTTCRDLLKYLGKLWGVEAPTKVETKTVVDFTEGRTIADLEYFAEHGCFPEEAPDAPRLTKPDPLASLH